MNKGRITMNLRILLWSGFSAAALFIAIGSAWLLSLPAAPAVAAPPSITRQEAAATVNALKPSKRQRPLVAIVGINDATETTDYLMPYGILRRADVADVVLLAAAAGPVKLYPALKVEPDATLAEFDARHPEGADYVVVPAMSRDDDPTVLQWLKNQASNGAMIIGVCAGAKVVAAAGLLDGKRATTHWYYLKELHQDHPLIRYVADRRLVVDGKIATTTGITAAMPAMLTLIEAIAGRNKAQATAADLGVQEWDVRHASSAFKFTRPFALTALANTLAFWQHERLGIGLEPGVDEVSLALVANAWSRTYRSRAVTFADAAPIETRNGVRIIPDEVGHNRHRLQLIPAVEMRQPAKALDETLDAISHRYGAHTSEFVAMQLEYPQQDRKP